VTLMSFAGLLRACKRREGIVSANTDQHANELRHAVGRDPHATRPASDWPDGSSGAASRFCAFAVRWCLSGQVRQLAGTSRHHLGVVAATEDVFWQCILATQTRHRPVDWSGGRLTAPLVAGKHRTVRGHAQLIRNLDATAV
jgi:hypothetical protein